MDRRKQLKDEYKQMKSEMGIFIVRSKNGNRCYIEGTQDLKTTLNSTKFKLQFGNHPNKGLQKEWREHGEEGFIIEIIDNLKYDKDELKTDYSEDLALLGMIWREKLSEKGMEFY